MMSELEKYREKIDRIDAQLVELFEERMQISAGIAGYKIKTGLAVQDPSREAEKLKKVMDCAHGDFNREAVREIFSQIMAISRKRQYQLLTEHGTDWEDEFRIMDPLPMTGSHVVFQGVEGAYSYAAMREYFGDSIYSSTAVTWENAMQAVQEGMADYAVLPIENSTAGIVAAIYDLLMKYQLYIIGEQIISVNHVLLGLPGTKPDDIRTVCSHPQGLAQCRPYLQAHARWKTKEAMNTALAAREVSENGDLTMAAIASREAGRLYGLEVLDDRICENQENETRFIILGAAPVHTFGASTVSICFELPHEKGSLYNMLSHIIYNGLNMTRIESRPVPGKNWQYRFFVDFEGNLKNNAVINALRGMKVEAVRLRILGNY